MLRAALRRLEIMFRRRAKRQVVVDFSHDETRGKLVYNVLHKPCVACAWKNISEISGKL